MDTSYWCDFVAGWIGGCTGLIVGHPMDTIKVRQQMHGMSAITGIKNTFKYEGIRGFYKGMAFPLLAAGTLNSLFFGVYGNAVRRLSKGKEKPSFTDIFLAGCAGGMAQLVVACPVDLIKIKIQMQIGVKLDMFDKRSSLNYKGPVEWIVDILRKDGLKGCYKGLSTMIWRDVPSFGLYMVIYEAFNRLISETNKTGPFTLVFAGGMAGAFSWAAILPLDVIKTRVQADNPLNPLYKGNWDCAVKSYRSDGPSVFFRGFSMMTLRAFPTNGAIFLGYVTSLNLLKKYSSDTDDNL